MTVVFLCGCLLQVKVQRIVGSLQGRVVALTALQCASQMLQLRLLLSRCFEAPLVLDGHCLF